MKRALVVAGSVVVLGIALAASGIASASTTSTAGKKPTRVTIVMHDPGCHWFQTRAGFKKALSVKGPVALFNVDEAAMIVKGPQGTKLDRVGKTLTLKKGVYTITMVKQAPDDNHLRLTVR